MKKVIKIRARTGISNLSEEWCVGNEDEVVFEISKSSSFMLFVEGIALGYLQEFVLAEKKISIQFHANSKKIQLNDLKNASPESLSDIVELDIPELLCGIFGLQLLYVSSGIYKAFDGLDNPTLARIHIGSVIWKTVLKQKGLLGDGKKRYLISRHDYRIPVLMRTGESLKFPSSDFFRSKISPIIGSIGKEQVTTLDAKTLVSSWIYHMVENVYEHGCVDIEKSNKVLEGYSGILIQKIATPSQEVISARHDLDENVKRYIEKLYQNYDFTNRDTLTVITVMDCGKGIQNTLPNQYDSCLNIERLNAAYTRGVTRHKIGEGRSGYGLPDSIRIANKLNAYVMVCSGDIYSFKVLDKLGAESITFSENYKNTAKSVGTAQSIIWPSASQN